MNSRVEVEEGGPQDARTAEAAEPRAVKTSTRLSRERSDMPGDEVLREETAHMLVPITVRVPKAVELTGLSRTKLYELIKANEIEVIKVGSSTLIVVASLHRFVERRRS